MSTVLGSSTLMSKGLVANSNMKPVLTANLSVHTGLAVYDIMNTGLTASSVINTGLGANPCLSEENYAPPPPSAFGAVTIAGLLGERKRGQKRGQGGR